MVIVRSRGLLAALMGALLWADAGMSVARGNLGVAGDGRTGGESGATAATVIAFNRTGNSAATARTFAIEHLEDATCSGGANGGMDSTGNECNTPDVLPFAIPGGSRETASHVDDPALQRDRDRVRAVVGAQLAQDILHVRLDRILRHG